MKGEGTAQSGSKLKSGKKNPLILDMETRREGVKGLLAYLIRALKEKKQEKGIISILNKTEGRI